MASRRGYGRSSSSNRPITLDEPEPEEIQVSEDEAGLLDVQAVIELNKANRKVPITRRHSRPEKGSPRRGNLEVVSEANADLSYRHPNNVNTNSRGANDYSDDGRHDSESETIP